MLTARAKMTRLALTVLFILGLLWGTAWGDDDNFPFGPFRMYSTTSKLDGVVRSAALEARFADGTTEMVPISPRNFGLRRAEIEGQLDRFIADPSRLSYVAEAYTNRHPDNPEIVALHLMHELTDLEGGRPVGTSFRVLAEWER